VTAGDGATEGSVGVVASEPHEVTKRTNAAMRIWILVAMFSLCCQSGVEARAKRLFPVRGARQATLVHGTPTWEVSGSQTSVVAA